MPQNGMAAASPNHPKACLFKDSYNFLALESGKAGHREICWIPTNSSEPKRSSFTAQANLDSFPDALHERVQSFRLGVATPQSSDGRDIKTFLVTFNDDSELSGVVSVTLAIGQY